jgi:phage replication-related protein YjqB (UPF0714/DUF867 family)
MILIERKFEDIAKNYVEGKDYRIRTATRHSDILIIAPHGGKIEPGTSEIAEAIASPNFSLFCFEGLKSRGNRLLHIESHCFNEPNALEIVLKSEVIIAVHGQNSRNSPFVMIGGLNSDLGLLIRDAVEASGFRTKPPTKGTKGCDPANICNRGKSGAGVQLEVSRNLREALKNNGSQLELFATSIRKAIQVYIAGIQGYRDQ